MGFSLRVKPGRVGAYGCIARNIIEGSNPIQKVQVRLAVLRQDLQRNKLNWSASDLTSEVSNAEHIA
jgi:hypothetical protein